MWLQGEGLVAPKPDDAHGHWYFVTRKGRQLKTGEQIDAYHRAAAFPRQLLHAAVAMKAEAPFMRGEYDTAVFHALKELEVGVRTACRYTASDYGVDMMRRAFHETTGPLTDLRAEVSERQALAHMFAGAIGSYKNAHSHRYVDLDATETVQLLVLVSNLLGIVDARRAKAPKRPRRRSTAGTVTKRRSVRTG
jgi:uncharacterized protein (TIGR02391 family)